VSLKAHSSSRGERANPEAIKAHPGAMEDRAVKAQLKPWKLTLEP
jgi:hypothetical protein